MMRRPVIYGRAREEGVNERDTALPKGRRVGVRWRLYWKKARERRLMRKE